MQNVVSVIIPAYNLGKCLEDTILSVCAQTLPQWQLIIVNDGSSDDTGIIADQYAAKDERIVVLHQANTGVSLARNNGLDIATGGFVCFLDGDDLWQPDSLEKLITKQKQTNAKLVYGKQNTLRLTGKIDNVYDKYPSGPILLAALQNGMVHIGASIIERDFLYKHDIRFTPYCALDEDTEFIWKILALTDAEAADGVVLTRRDRDGSASRLKWSWKGSSDSIASFERLTDFVKKQYTHSDKSEVLSFLSYAVNFRRYRALWNLLKRKQYSTVLEKLDDKEWGTELAEVSLERFSMSQKIEYSICMTKNILLWKSIVRFLS